MSPMVPMTERSENLPSVNVHQMMGPATPMTPVIILLNLIFVHR